jgi:serine/threonine-protein kinase HipA
MILSDNGWMLSPAYDLLNVKIILPSDKDETALLLGGKKKKHSRAYFERFGDQLELNNKQIQSVFKRIEKWLPKAQLLINKSFLPKDLKLEYIEVISTQVAKLEA